MVHRQPEFNSDSSRKKLLTCRPGQNCLRCRSDQSGLLKCGRAKGKVGKPFQTAGRERHHERVLVPEIKDRSLCTKKREGGIHLPVLESSVGSAGLQPLLQKGTAHLLVWLWLLLAYAGWELCIWLLLSRCVAKQQLELIACFCQCSSTDRGRILFLASVSVCSRQTGKSSFCRCTILRSLPQHYLYLSLGNFI